jgi:hypothetical protein
LEEAPEEGVLDGVAIGELEGDCLGLEPAGADKRSDLKDF